MNEECLIDYYSLTINSCELVNKLDKALGIEDSNEFQYKLKRLEKRANQNDSEAILELGTYYEENNEYEKALELYKKSLVLIIQLD